MDLSAIQQALRERNIDAWLFYDHHHRDPISYRVLGLPDGLMVTRRWDCNKLSTLCVHSPMAMGNPTQILITGRDFRCRG